MKSSGENDTSTSKAEVTFCDRGFNLDGPLRGWGQTVSQRTVRIQSVPWYDMLLIIVLFLLLRSHT